MAQADPTALDAGQRQMRPGERDHDGRDAREELDLAVTEERPQLALEQHGDRAERQRREQHEDDGDPLQVGFLEEIERGRMGRKTTRRQGREGMRNGIEARHAAGEIGDGA